MYYQIAGIKHRCLMMIGKDEICKRDIIKSCFGFVYLFDEKIISTLYITDNDYFVDENAIQSIFDILLVHDIKFKLNEFNDLVKVVENYIQIHIESMDDFKKQHSIIQEKINTIIENKKNFDNKFKTLLPKSIDTAKTVAIDFEYANRKNKHSLFYEMGIAVQENGEIAHYHYIIREHNKYKKDFNFGESILISVNDINSIVSQHLQNATYIVGHNVKCEHALLDELNFPWSDFPDLQFLCTPTLIYRNFQIYKEHDAGMFQDHVSLGTALKHFGIAATSLHNSGNDAAYTLQLLNALIKTKEMALKINPNQRHKVKLKKPLAIQ